MLSLGADPRSKGPGLYTDGDGTAVEEACLSGKVEVLRLFKVIQETDDLSELLKDASLFGYAEMTRYLLDLGAKPNDKANGGSSALGACRDERNAKFQVEAEKRSRGCEG
jgi:hypothetical protein